MNLFFSIVVSPYIGEWIEISSDNSSINSDKVSPYIGEWIEIRKRASRSNEMKVSPYIGEWIEILATSMICPNCTRLTLHR